MFVAVRQLCAHAHACVLLSATLEGCVSYTRGLGAANRFATSYTVIKLRTRIVMRKHVQFTSFSFIILFSSQSMLTVQYTYVWTHICVQGVIDVKHRKSILVRVSSFTS